MVKTLKEAKIDRLIEPLQEMFKSGTYEGTLETETKNQKKRVTIRTTSILTVAGHDNAEFEALLDAADNYSFHAENNTLVVRMGFYVGYYPGE